MNVLGLLGFYFLDTLKLHFLLWEILNFEKAQKNKKMNEVIIICAAVVIMTNYLAELKFREVIVSVIVIICAMHNMKGMKRKILVVPIYLVICVVDALLGGFVAIMMHNTTEVMLQNKLLMFVLNSLSLIILLIIYLVMQWHNLKKINVSNYIKDNKNIRSILLITFGIIGMIFYIIPFQVYGINKLDIKGKETVIGISISGAIFLGVLIVLVYFNIKNNYFKECLQLNNEMLNAQKEYYKALLEKEEETKKFRHDVLNHLYCMKRFEENGDIEKLGKYLEDMLEDVKVIKDNIHTGNDTLDIVLSDILSNDANDQIPIIWKGVFPEKVNMSDMDLCILFANIFKNAFEAENNIRLRNRKTEDFSDDDVYNADCVDGADDADDAVSTYGADGIDGKDADGAVNVEVKCMNNNILVTFKNRCLDYVPINNKKLTTTKKDNENHGYGSMNVWKIIEKYKGEIEYRQENNMFVTEIILINVIK